MLEILAMIYLWLKAGHVIFVVFWMAGLFILPRQMIYMHPAAARSDEEVVWAQRMVTLRRMILTPSLIAVWLLGILLATSIGAWDQTWLHAKLLVVVALTAYHGWMVAQSKRMAKGERPLTDRQLRLWGEAPAFGLILIVVLVIVGPAYLN